MSSYGHSTPSCFLLAMNWMGAFMTSPMGVLGVGRPQSSCLVLLSSSSSPATLRWLPWQPSTTNRSMRSCLQCWCMTGRLVSRLRKVMWSMRSV